MKSKNYGRSVSIGITITIVMMLILSGPVSAVTVGISGLAGTTHTNGDSVTFRVSAKINDVDHYVPIDNYSLAITGATSKEIVFSTDGSVLSGDLGIGVSKVSGPANDYGYGYGYGYDFNGGQGHDFFGYGYGYGYGYANGAGGTEVEYLYDITIDTSILNNGAHDAKLSLNTGDSAKPSFESSSSSFTIDAASTTSSSSGGSIGGSTGSSLEAYSNVETKKVVRKYIQKDVDTKYTFIDPSNPIGSVGFTPIVNAGYISVSVEVLNDVSTLVDTTPPGKVYKNLNIWVGSGGWATSNTVLNPIITFSVDKSWVSENNIDPATVKLLRYTTMWTELKTTKTGEDAEKIYYSAETPGFSPFAISATSTEGEEVTATVSSGTTASGEIVAQTEKATISAPVEEEGEGTGIPGFEGIFAIMGLLSIAAFTRMQKRRG